jgi:hypothetical protein
MTTANPAEEFPMRTCALIPCTLALLAASTPAQTITAPGGYATTEGATSFRYVQYNPARHQTIYGSKLMPGKAMSIKGIKYRGDGPSSYGVTHTYTHRVFVSNQTIDPLTGYGIRWQGNHGPDMTMVMDKVAVNWPGYSTPLSPQPFNVVFPFTAPFSYQGKAFVVDVENFKDGTGKYFHFYNIDAVTGSGTYTVDYGRATRFGKSCPHSSTAARRFGLSTYKIHRHGPLYMYAKSQVDKQQLPGLCFHGISKTGWAGLPLPFDLTHLGGPGCSLYTDMVISFTSFTDPASSRGHIAFDMGTVPQLASLPGAIIYSQAAVVDLGYNSLGMRMSDCVESKVGKGFAGAIDGFTFYAYEDSATTAYQVDPTFSTYSYKYVPIIELY